MQTSGGAKAPSPLLSTPLEGGRGVLYLRFYQCILALTLRVIALILTSKDTAECTTLGEGGGFVATHRLYS